MHGELKLENDDWTYLGLLDDKVAEYPWHDRRIDAAYFDLTLRLSALFEGRLLVNDAYLLPYDWTLDHFIDGGSLFRRLMNAGRVAMFSRRGDGRVDRMILEMDNIPDIDRIRRRPDWKTVQERLEAASTGDGYVYARWPDRTEFDNARGFDRIVEEVEGSEVEGTMLASVEAQDMKQIFAAYRRQREEDLEGEAHGKRPPGARTVWERTVANFRAEGDRARLMWFANEAYHYNMALAVASRDGASVGVSTIAVGQTCARFASQGDPLEFERTDIAHEIVSLDPVGFVAMVEATKDLRIKYRIAVRAHSDPNRSTRVEAALREYVAGIATWIASNRRQLRHARVGTAVAIAAAGAVSYATLGWEAAALATATVGLTAAVQFLGSQHVAHEISGWSRRGYVARRVRQLPRVSGVPFASTGTFQIDPQQARAHVEHCRPVSPADSGTIVRPRGTARA